MKTEQTATPQDLINEAERLGFRNVEWGDFPKWDDDDHYIGFLRFQTPEEAEAFLDLLGDDSIDSFEPGDYSVDVPRGRINETLETLKEIKGTDSWDRKSPPETPRYPTVGRFELVPFGLTDTAASTCGLCRDGFGTAFIETFVHVNREPSGQLTCICSACMATIAALWEIAERPCEDRYQDVISDATKE